MNTTAIIKSEATRCNRVAPARKTSPPAGTSRPISIAQKRRRAKYRLRRAIALLVLCGVFSLTVWGIAALVSAIMPSNAIDLPDDPVNEVTRVEAPAIVTSLPLLDEQPEDPAPRYALSAAERDVVERVVMAESGGESLEGQMLVAQCILTACEKTGLQPSEVVVKYKYTTRRPDPSQRVKDAVAAVFDRGECIVDEPVMYFYNPALVRSDFHESQIFVIEVGGHRFFAERSNEQ